MLYIGHIFDLDKILDLCQILDRGLILDLGQILVLGRILNLGHVFHLGLILDLGQIEVLEKHNKFCIQYVSWWKAMVGISTDLLENFTQVFIMQKSY